MVRQLSTTELRTQDTTEIAVVNHPSNKERTLFRFINDLDAYVEVTLTATDSTDPDFNNSVAINNSRPVPAGEAREIRYTGPYELLRFEITATQSTPTTGSFKLRDISDHADAELQSESINRFEALNQGKTFVTRYKEEISSNGNTVSVGVQNNNDTTLFIDKLGFPVGGDALIRTKVDNATYSDGTNLDTINGRLELQTERTIDSSITTNPSHSDPQVEIEGFIPGGSGRSAAATPGRESAGAEYEISPGQNIVFELENQSGSTNYFGFSLRFTETVIR